MSNEQWASDEQIEHARQVMARINAETPSPKYDLESLDTNKKSVRAAQLEERAKAAAATSHLLQRLDRLTEGTGRLKVQVAQMEAQRKRVLQYVIQLQAMLANDPDDKLAVAHLMQLLRDTLADVPQPL